jgi:hypothetical protein
MRSIWSQVLGAFRRAIATISLAKIRRTRNDTNSVIALVGPTSGLLLSSPPLIGAGGPAEFELAVAALIEGHIGETENGDGVDLRPFFTLLAHLDSG